MGILITLFILGVLGQLIYYFQQKGASVIVSHIGGFVVGINYVSHTVESEDFTSEEVFESEQHILSISLAFLSLTFIWYVGEEEVE
jgi:hypothetical protein